MGIIFNHCRLEFRFKKKAKTHLRVKDRPKASSMTPYKRVVQPFSRKATFRVRSLIEGHFLLMLSILFDLIVWLFGPKFIEYSIIPVWLKYGRDQNFGRLQYRCGQAKQRYMSSKKLKKILSNVIALS